MRLPFFCLFAFALNLYNKALPRSFSAAGPLFDGKLSLLW